MKIVNRNSAEPSSINIEEVDTNKVYGVFDLRSIYLISHFRGAYGTYNILTNEFYVVQDSILKQVNTLGAFIDFIYKNNEDAKIYEFKNFEEFSRWANQAVDF